jgi:hypothetical protein
MAPLNHLWYRQFVHTTARFAYRIYNAKIGLQRIQRRDRRLAL